MRGVIGLSILALAATAGPVFGQSKSTQLAKKNGWHDTLSSAKAAAAKSGKPIFLVFRCDP